MSRDEELKRDGLKEYFGGSAIEKAPEGFTSKVMSHIYMQSKPVRHKKSPVLYFYGGITALLVIASFILPSGKLKFPEITLPEGFRLAFPHMEESLKISPVILYVFAAIILLVIFDTGLKTFFHSEKN